MFCSLEFRKSILYDITNLFVQAKASLYLRTERRRESMSNAELILRLVEMLLKEREDTMKAKEQQDKTKE